MDSSGTERKRTLSLSGLSPFDSKLNIGLGSETDHPNLPRIRHPSFALAADRPGVLDGLIDAASNKIRSPAEKDAGLDSHDQCTAENSQTREPLSAQVIAALDESEFSMDSRKNSTATVVAPAFEHCQISETKPNLSAGTRNSNQHSSASDMNNLLDNDSLSSHILKLYLSKLPVGNAKENGGKTVISPLISTKSCISETHQNVHVPEYFQIHSPAVASMTMPVNQITRAYSRFYGNSNRFSPNVPKVVVHPLYERNALTDANYSSGLSDTESRHSPKSRGKSTCGYQSDHYMLEAASEVRKLQMTGRRLELDFHRSTASLSSPPRSHSGGSTPIIKRRISASARDSKFNLTQVYDGLLPTKTPSSPSPSSDWSVSNASLDATLVNRLTNPATKSDCLTPPASPISSRAFGCINSTSTENCDANPSTLNRLRSMLTNFKHNLQEDEENKYFYMDEQSLERRAQAQASNVIAPVSF